MSIERIRLKITRLIIIAMSIRRI